MHRIAARSHADDNPFGVRGADIFVQLVLAACQFCEFVHVLLDDRGTCVVIFIDRFPALEKDVGVLGGPFDCRVVGGQCAFTHIGDISVINHCPHVVESEGFYFLDFVGGPESVVEMNERNAGFERCRLCDKRKIHCFLHRG